MKSGTIQCLPYRQHLAAAYLALADAIIVTSDSVNMVSAPVLARERGIRVEEVRRGREGAYETYIRDLYQNNALVKGEHWALGRRVQLRDNDFVDVTSPARPRTIRELIDPRQHALRRRRSGLAALLPQVRGELL